jgi:hypothetical protein
MAGFADKIGDLSWLGDAYVDMGWVVVGDAPPSPATSTTEELAWEQAKKLLTESDWAVLSDVPMTSGDRAAWIEYRRALREIRLHPDFPNMTWPARPE